MALATWWCGDQLPALSPLTTFSAGPMDNATLLAQMAHLDGTEVQTRINQGHRPYVAWLAQQAVAYGWVATQTAYVGELDVTIALPPAARYLWDFATLPDWRGRGLYPRLLQAILSAESPHAERFWIIAAPENRASSAGIAKAGFTSVAHLSFQRAGQPGLIPMDSRDRTPAAAALLNVPVLDAEPYLALSPCWHCAIDARQDGRDLTAVACWPATPPADLLAPTCHCG